MVVIKKGEKRILFVCRYNRFRSVMAEGFFNKYNKNNKWRAKSAGAVEGFPLSENVKKLAKEFGLRIKKKPEGLTSKALSWQNITVVVADDVPSALFQNKENRGKKVILWNIKDAKGKTFEEAESLALKIKEQVKKLLMEMERKV